MTRTLACLTLASVVACVAACRPQASAPGTAQAAEQTQEKSTNMETATFGAGCFWGVEAAFRKLPGVHSTAVGYCGGNLDRPTYKDVCTDQTGHAEAVQIEFDPAKITYTQLLDAFFSLHDPTTVNRQGPDLGTQYRSVIFYHSPQQQAAAEAAKAALDRSGKLSRSVVTQIVPAAPFWRAEEYHQRYLEKRGLSSCGVGH